MNIIEQATQLLSKVPPVRYAFVASVLDFHRRNGFITDKQQQVLAKIIHEMTAPPMIVDLSPVHAMLMKARDRGLKRPKININIGEDHLSISLAGRSSVNAGYLYVKSNGEYKGKISPAGKWTGDTALVSSLQAFAADPAGLAKAHGDTTGNCCFCGRGLTDRRSVEAGYGPTCAVNFGLPWGETPDYITAMIGGEYVDVRNTEDGPQL